jgi:hypothetical protein
MSEEAVLTGLVYSAMEIIRLREAGRKVQT